MTTNRSNITLESLQTEAEEKRPPLKPVKIYQIISYSSIIESKYSIDEIAELEKNRCKEFTKHQEFIKTIAMTDRNQFFWVMQEMNRLISISKPYTHSISAHDSEKIGLPHRNGKNIFDTIMECKELIAEYKVLVLDHFIENLHYDVHVCHLLTPEYQAILLGDEAYLPFLKRVYILLLSQLPFTESNKYETFLNFEKAVLPKIFKHDNDYGTHFYETVKKANLKPEILILYYQRMMTDPKTFNALLETRKCNNYFSFICYTLLTQKMAGATDFAVWLFPYFLGDERNTRIYLDYFTCDSMPLYYDACARSIEKLSGNTLDSVIKAYHQLNLIIFKYNTDLIPDPELKKIAKLQILKQAQANHALAKSADITDDVKNFLNPEHKQLLSSNSGLKILTLFATNPKKAEIKLHEKEERVTNQRNKLYLNK